jgi:Ca2+-binding RTX toxin-like protein
MAMPLKFGTDNSETIFGGPFDDTIFAGDGDDKVYGYFGDDQLFGEDGDDVLIGGAGADLLDGGAGTFDTASYSFSPAGVSINLETGHGSGGDAEGDTLQNIERVVGSDYNDVLIGDDGNNHLQGNGGNDSLIGGEGNDWLWGFSDNDFLAGGEGNDRAYGGEGKDFLKGGGGHDHLYGEDGNDHLYGEDGIDYLYGGDGKDYLHGGDGADDLAGGAGNDTLVGGNGHDHLEGGAGADTLTGGSGTGDTFIFKTYTVTVDDDVVEFYFDSDASNPDHIVDFGHGANILGDLIDMPTAGTARNYIETTLGYNVGYVAAKNWADPAISSGNGFAFAFATDGVNGYLFADPFGGHAATGIVLEGLTSVDQFDHSYIF